MNKHDVTDWKNSPVTKAIISNINEAVKDVRERSSVRETADLTAMQTSRDEGFVEGVNALIDSMDDLDLVEDDNNV